MSDRRKFRASQVPQALFCPGSALLIRRMKPSKNSAASLIGQWCHYTSAKRFIDEHGAVPPETELVGPVMPKGWEPHSFHRWMVDYFVSVALDFAHVDMALLVEAEFFHAFERFDLSGHADVIGITADATEAVGLDLKTGTDEVTEAEQNAQILTYIVLLKLAYPTLRKIRFGICQPTNNPDEGMERVTMATVEGDQLDGVVAYLERELNHAIDHERELNSDGYKACRYCPAADQCPAIDGDLNHMKMTLTDEHLAMISAEASGKQLLALEFARKKFTPIFERANLELKERARAAGTLRIGEHCVFLEVHPRGTEITDNKVASERLADMPDELYHRTYSFSTGELDRALAEHESQKTGSKVPIESKVPGKASGKSIRKALLKDVSKELTSEWLRVTSVS